MTRKRIEVYINEVEDYENKFHSERLSSELSDYILSESRAFPVKDDLEIAIFLENGIHEKQKIKKLIVENFEAEFTEISLLLEKNKILSLLAFLSGILILFVLMFLKMIPIISEVVLIFGWVFIWEGIYNYCFSGTKHRLKRKRLKKLLKAKIIFYDEKAS